MTSKPGTLLSLSRTASVTPSAKYASAESPRFSKGSTANRVGPVRWRPDWACCQVSKPTRMRAANMTTASNRPLKRGRLPRPPAGVAMRLSSGAYVGVGPVLSVPAMVSASANASAVEKRSAGVLDKLAQVPGPQRVELSPGRCARGERAPASAWRRLPVPRSRYKELCPPTSRTVRIPGCRGPIVHLLRDRPDSARDSCTLASRQTRLPRSGLQCPRT